MADEELSSVNSSLNELLKSLEAAHEADLSAEERLNQLKTQNAVRLAALNKSQQEEFYKAAEADFAEKARQQQKLHNQKVADMQKEFKASSKMSDAEFKQQFKMTRKQYQEKIKLEQKAAKSAEKDEANAAKKAAALKRAAATKEYEQQFGVLTGKGHTLIERGQALKGMATDADGKFDGSKLANSLTKALGDLAKQLDSQIDKVYSYKGAIDTRLQGLNRGGGFFGGSSQWDSISTKLTGIAGASPFIKQSALAERVNQMVSQGIAFNVEQRATLAELSGKIATTFDAANGTLLRLVRIQQQDTTAGRLGMESALTAFLNNMYETTEYMSNIATTIKGSLEEAMSLMTGENALSFEYQVQKWLGSMYSVGMSDSAVQGLGGVLGKLASGQIDAITQGGQGNLVIMAANQAGLSVSDLMSNGLNADTTNQLMNSMVEYLAKIYEEAGDSKVIQQQMASVYGMTASDLRAAVNLAKSAGIVSRDGLTYSGAISRLNTMANSMYKRTSVGEMMGNAFDNLQYTMAAGIANNPALYAMYKVAGMLDTVAGGIAIPAFSVMGNMVDLETTVADLMRAGAMGGSILSGIGTMIASGGNGGLTGGGILKAAGIGNGISTVTRGTGVGLKTAGGATVSESGSIVGNSSGSDVQNKTMTDATDSGNSQLASAVEGTEDTKLHDVYAEVVEIYRLLQDIASGSYTIPVDVQNSSLKIDVQDLGL